MLGAPRTEYELRCFLHCHGEGETEIRGRGWPLAYWSADMIPSDVARAGPGRFDPFALGLDLIALGLVLCGLAVATSALQPQRRVRDHLRAALHSTNESADC